MIDYYWIGEIPCQFCACFVEGVGESELWYWNCKEIMRKYKEKIDLFSFLKKEKLFKKRKLLFFAF